MEKIGSLISQDSKTDSHKKERWLKILEARYNRARDKATYLDRKYNKDIFVYVDNFVTLEIDGGKCRTCRKDWLRVEFESHFYIGHYHVPNCDCGCICPVCISVLDIEQQTYELKNDSWKCPHCGYQLAELNGMGEIMRNLYGKSIAKDRHLLVDNMERRALFLANKFSESTIKEITEKTGIDFTQWTIYNGLILDPPVHGEIVNKEK